MSSTPESTSSLRVPGGCDGTHTASIDEDRRADGACAQVHLPTGRMCTLRYRHEGTCEFVVPDEITTSLAHHRSAEQW